MRSRIEAGFFEAKEELNGSRQNSLGFATLIGDVKLPAPYWLQMVSIWFNLVSANHTPCVQALISLSAN